MNKNIEQTSIVLAEDTLPKLLTYNDRCEILLGVDERYPLNIKCFYSHSGSVFVGTIIKETDDSFLVGSATKLVMHKSRQVIAEPITSEPMLRLMKFSVQYLVTPTEITIYHYCKFIEQFGYKKLPDFFNEERRNWVTSILEQSGTRGNICRRDLMDYETVKEETPGIHKHSFVPYTKSESIH